MKGLYKRFLGKKGSDDGWTFIETLIVIAIVVILMTTVAVFAFRGIGQAKSAQVKASISAIKTALELYRNDCDRYPTRSQGLKALYEKPMISPIPEGWVRPYVEKSFELDAWGFPYEYYGDETGSTYEVKSLGADGRPGGEGDNADISSKDVG